MKDLTFLDKQKLPYVLLHDPQTGRAAAYTTNHRLIVEEASEKLIRYALEHTANRAAFVVSMHDDSTRRLPAWAKAEDLSRMELVWIQRPMGDDPDEHWRAIPAA